VAALAESRLVAARTDTSGLLTAVVHHSHRFRAGDHYCAWCGAGKTSARAVDRCDYNLIATDPNWKPENFTFTAETVAKIKPPLTPEEAALERKKLKERLRRQINATVAQLNALESEP